MSHYNYLELRKYQKRIEQARQSGEADEVIEELEKRAKYLQKPWVWVRSPSSSVERSEKRMLRMTTGWGRGITISVLNGANCHRTMVEEALLASKKRAVVIRLPLAVS